MGFCTVTDLRTGHTQVYSCPPDVAVVCAYEQARGNYNTWTYDRSLARLANRTWVCGDFAALRDRNAV